MSENLNIFGKPRAGKQRTKKPAKKPAKPRTKKPKPQPEPQPAPRREPSMCYEWFYDSDGWIHVIVPPDAQCCDVMRTWGDAYNAR